MFDEDDALFVGRGEESLRLARDEDLIGGAVRACIDTCQAERVSKRDEVSS